MPGKPGKNESKHAWVGKCIGITKAENPDMAINQVAAICFSEWKQWKKKEHKKSTGEGIIEAIAKELKDNENPK